MKATSPLVHEVNWSMVTLFSERIKRSPSLAPTAIRLLAHKIQSPVQKEASYALVVRIFHFKNININRNNILY